MYIYHMENKKCLECGETVTGRTDKKNLIRNINNRLKKNHKILTELNKTGKTKVTRTKLYDNGFDFNFFTSIYTTKTGNTYYYVYDQGYLSLENELFLLIKKER